MAIFHGFSDSDCKKVLLNLKIAIGNKSSYVVIVDAILEEVNIDSITASVDMQMLIGTKGRERILKEWNKLFVESGFKIEKVLDTRIFAKYIVIRPQ
jgi:hydrogenase maturation factor